MTNFTISNEQMQQLLASMGNGTYTIPQMHPIHQPTGPLIGPIKHNTKTNGPKQEPYKGSKKPSGKFPNENEPSIILPQAPLFQQQSPGIFPPMPNQNGFFPGLPLFVQAYWQQMAKTMNQMPQYPAELGFGAHQPNFHQLPPPEINQPVTMTPNSVIQVAHPPVKNEQSTQNGQVMSRGPDVGSNVSERHPLIVKCLQNNNKAAPTNISFSQCQLQKSNFESSASGISESVPVTPMPPQMLHPPPTKLKNDKDIQFIGFFKKPGKETPTNENVYKSIDNQLDFLAKPSGIDQRTKPKVVEPKVVASTQSLTKCLLGKFLKEHQAKMTAETSKRIQVETELSQQKNRATLAEKNLETLHIFNRNLRKIASQNKSKIAKTEKSAAKSEEESKKKQEQIGELEKEKANLLEKVDCLENNLNTVKAQIKSEAEAFEETFQYLRQEKGRLEAKCKASDQECTTWRREAEQQKRQVDELNDELEQTKEEKEQLARGLHEIQTTIARVTGQLYHLLPADLFNIPEQHPENN